MTSGLQKTASVLETEVQFLKGIGPKLAMQLKKAKIETVADALWYMPRRYDDRRNLPRLVMLRPGHQATVRGTVAHVSSKPLRGGKVLVKAVLSDGSGEVDLVWFNQPWVGREIQRVQGEVVAFGMVKEGMRGRLEIHSADWEEIDDDDDTADFARLSPVYPLVEGLGQKVVRKACRSAVDHFADQMTDPLPREVLNRGSLPALAWSVRQMHRPDSEESLQKARHRLVFEEFLYLQLGLQMRRQQVHQEVGIQFPVSSLPVSTEDGHLFAENDSRALPIWDQIERMLPFQMTKAQTRVVKEVFRDMESPHPMNRLVQGDVGSGKTAVAASAMLAAVRCGYQAALMAPTEILAEQHGLNLKRLFEPLGVSVVTLVGSQGAQARKKALQAAAAGTAQICIGTHALIQEGVTFHRLGLVVIDEQHRFGVVQRMSLRQKGLGNPDVLVMTATPIPRTLTMTLYGDLDLSVIDELPPGRKPVRTHWKKIDQRDSVYQKVRNLVEEGRQAYVVCPLISESEKMEAQAAEDLYYRLSTGALAGLKIGLLHGQMKTADKEAVMDSFRKGETSVLVSTTVIEVGVDVPNATVMVIEDANRFGLAQLHQLRGRVGRAHGQSFCILVAQATTPDAEYRLGVMVNTTDGFRIAEEDLKIRGPGDIAGTRQSGILEFRIANLIDDGPVLEEARQCAIGIIDRDPDLSQPHHSAMLEKVKERRSDEAMIVVS